jgi:tetratricopeptide (TPR) repeat protein
LLTVVAELAQLAGWVASDAGRYAEAQHIYLTGMSAARSASRPALAAQLLSSLSYQIANVGDSSDATLLARSAVTGARDVSPVVKSLLLERVAWASSRAQDNDGAQRALDAVDASYENRCDSIEEPHWVYWLDRREIDIMAGRCFVELGEPDVAATLLSHAITNYAPGHSREVALYQTWLAESYVKIGAFDAGKQMITRPRKVSEAVNSSRLEMRISEIEQLVISRWEVCHEIRFPSNINPRRYNPPFTRWSDRANPPSISPAKATKLGLTCSVSSSVTPKEDHTTRTAQPQRHT